MATEKQTAANRENAQKSTGPRTAEGKARSSQNALKTGIDAQSEIIRGESREKLETLIVQIDLEYCPVTSAERFQPPDAVRGEAALPLAYPLFHYPNAELRILWPSP